MKYEVMYKDNDGWGWVTSLATTDWQEALDDWSFNYTPSNVKFCNKIRVRTPENIAFDLSNEEQLGVHSAYLLYQESVNNRIEQRIAKEHYMTTFDITPSYNSTLGEPTDNSPDILEDLAKLDIPYQGPRNEPLYPEWEIEDMFKEDFDEDLKLMTTDFHGNFDKMTEAQQDAIINPKHYKMLSSEVMSKHPDGMEYIDLMAYLLEGHTGVQAHLLGQIYKYSMRLGKKDNKLQDAKKIEWYASRLAKEIEESSNG